MSAVAKLIPNRPARVDSKKQKKSLLGALNLSNDACLSAVDTNAQKERNVN